MMNEEQRKRHWGSPEHNSLEQKYSEERYSYPVKDLEDIYSGKVILDCGCGWGAGAVKIAKAHTPKQIIAIDVNDEALELAKKSYTHELVDYRKELIFDTKLDDESVDTIITVEVVEHVDSEELDLSFKEFYRVLKDGGKLYVSTPELRGNREDFPKGSHFMEYEFMELIELIVPYGFRLVWSKRKGEHDSISMALVFEKDKK